VLWRFWWARSWSSCFLSGVENERSKRSFEVGVLSSGVKELEFSSWLDWNPNQAEVKGFCGKWWQAITMVVAKQKLDLLLQLVQVGPDIALVGSVVRSLDDQRFALGGFPSSRFQGFRDKHPLKSRTRTFRESEGRFKEGEVRYIPKEV